MKTYMLILRDQEIRWPSFSREQAQAVIDRFNAWNARLRADERLVGAGKLSQDLGVTVRQEGDGLVVDGPFSEAKEAIMGYYCVQAETLDEASTLAKGCPILTYGGSVEVRELEYQIGE